MRPWRDEGSVHETYGVGGDIRHAKWAHWFCSCMSRGAEGSIREECVLQHEVKLVMLECGVQNAEAKA